MILGINAGLEYPDGRNANIDNGLWLHHMVSSIHLNYGLNPIMVHPLMFAGACG